MDATFAEYSFHAHSVLRQLCYYQGTLDLRVTVGAMGTDPVGTSMAITSMLHLTKRSPGLLDALVREMMIAREGSEPLKNLAEQEWSNIKIDVIGDSSLITHLGASTPGAKVVGNKIEKPPGWEPSVAELHIGMKRMLGVSCSLDVAAEGGCDLRRPR